MKYITLILLILILNVSYLNYRTYQDRQTLYALIDCDTTIIKSNTKLFKLIAIKMKALYYSDSIKYEKIKALEAINNKKK